MRIFNVQVDWDRQKYVVVPATSKEEALDAAATILADWQIPREKLSVVQERKLHDVVGHRFTGPRITQAELDADRPPVFLCIAWDWRTGFWMRNEATGEMRSISERAPGRTFHLVRGAGSDNPDPEEEAPNPGTTDTQGSPHMVWVSTPCGTGNLSTPGKRK
jgi:hypothetical protein